MKKNNHLVYELFFLIFLSSLLCLSSCKKSVKQKLGNDSTIIQPVKPTWKEQEARLIDISIPIEAEPIFLYQEEKSLDENPCMLSYVVSLSVSELVAFYRHEMDWHGWCEKGGCEGGEYLLVFSKPSKWCVISLRPEKNQKTLLVISLIYKKEKDS